MVLLDLVSEESSTASTYSSAYPLSRPNVQRLAELRRRARRRESGGFMRGRAGRRRHAARPRDLLDVNKLHYNRTGAPAENADQHAAVVAAAGTRFAGVHYYDGHLDLDELSEAYDELVKSVLPRLPLDGTRFGAAGEVPRVTSGTPTFEGALRYDWQGAPHQISPGTVVFTDVRTLSQVSEASARSPPRSCSAARCRGRRRTSSRSMSRKSVAAEVGDRVHRRRRPPRARAAQAIGGAAARPPAARRVADRAQHAAPRSPVHVCPTVNLAESRCRYRRRRRAVVPTWSARALRRLTSRLR